MNTAVAEGIAAALDELDDDDALVAGILTGAGGFFSAGMDLKAFLRGERPHVGDRGFAGITQRPPSKPLIAAVEGPALAGGCELVLSCDLVVASEEATFGIPEVKRGLAAAAGGLMRLPARIPRTVAMELALTGDPMSAADAPPVGAGQPPHARRRGPRGRPRARRAHRGERTARGAGEQAGDRRVRRLERGGHVAPPGRDPRPGAEQRGRPRGRRRLRREARPGVARAADALHARVFGSPRRPRSTHVRGARLRGCPRRTSRRAGP